MPDQPDLSYIAEPLRQFAVPIDTLIEDPANPNLHDDRSIRAIMGSFAQFGQRLPITYNPQTQIVQVGNGRLEAARRMGWTHLAALPFDDDRLTETLFAITENRTSELSHFDPGILVKLIEQLRAEDAGEAGSDLLDEMFTPIEWETLLEEIDIFEDAEDGEPPSLDDLADAFGGEPEASDFWPFVRVQVPPETYEVYEDLMAQAPGADETAKFTALLEAVDAAVLGGES